MNSYSNTVILEEGEHITSVEEGEGRYSFLGHNGRHLEFC